MNQQLLSEYQIGYPILKILADFRYRKVGTPTVFDELLMSLSVDFPQLKNNSLNDILETVQVDKIFIRYALKNLLDTGLIEHRYFDESLDNVRLSELVLTENGKKFYREKKMPGKPRKAQEYFYVNPLSGEIVNKILEESQNADFQLNGNLFSINDEILKSLSRDKLKDFSWVTSDVELEANGISTHIDNGKNKWQEVKINLSLDQNRNLTLECQDILFKQWLNSRDSTFLRENLLFPLLERAENALSSKERLDNKLLSNNDLVNFTLADKNISFNELSSTVLMLKVAPNNQEITSKNLPLIVLSRLHEEATLTEQMLFIPNEWDLPKNLTKVFVSIKEEQLFAEYEGYLPAYFDHQDIYLPIRYVQKWNERLTDLETFKTPNVDTLVFLSNFKTEQEILKQLPRMSIQQAAEFAQKITDTWKKGFAPSQWSEKIEQLGTEEELAKFVGLFKSLPEFSNLDIKLQNIQIDLALKDSKCQAAKFSKLKYLVELSNDLAKFNAEKLQLNVVNSETLLKLNQWKKVTIDFEHNNSMELTKRNKYFTSHRERILILFEPEQENEKFAVLDTNYIINHSDRMGEIKNTHRLVLPKIVLIELDRLKKESQNKLTDFDEELDKIKPILQTQLEKIATLLDQIKQCNIKLTQLEENMKEITNKNRELKKIKETTDTEKKQIQQYNLKFTSLEKDIREIKNEKKLLEETKKNTEKELNKIKDDQIKIEKSRKEIDEKFFKIRKAARQLSELQFEKVGENVDILEMIVESATAVADDKILAVACAYKLNDITLYTGDNILKAKAKSIGIKTSS